MKTWDVLVPTFHARTPLYLQLLEQLAAQVRPGVSVIVARDDRTEPIGDKLQRLMEASAADYTCVCADDALLHPQYVELIHGAMQASPDAIGFKLRIGSRPAQVHSIAFHGVPGLGCDDGTYWGPHHCDLGTWMPVKRSIGSLVRFHGGGGEDARWTSQVAPMLRTEFYISEVLVTAQVVDQGFHGHWEPVEATPNPERSFITYI